MIDIAMGDVYCPKYGEINLKPCPRPPQKQVMMDMINQIIKTRYGSSKVLPQQKSRLPEGSWLVQVINVLDPNSKLFEKDYAPQKSFDNMIPIKFEALPNNFKIHPLFAHLPKDLVVKRKTLKGKNFS